MREPRLVRAGQDHDPMVTPRLGQLVHLVEAVAPRQAGVEDHDVGGRAGLLGEGIGQADVPGHLDPSRVRAQHGRHPGADDVAVAHDQRPDGEPGGALTAHGEHRLHAGMVTPALLERLLLAWQPFA